MKGLISFRVVIESGDQDANEERGAVIAANFAKLPERTAVENLTIEQDVVGELHQSARRCQEALPAADNGDWLTYRMIRSRIEGTE